MMRLIAVAVAVWAALAVTARAMTEVVEVTSPGGITAWLVEDHAVPLLALEAHFDGGPILDPDESLGATHLMGAMLSEGAGDLDAVGFAAAREAVAARFSFGAGRDDVTVSAVMLTEFREDSLDLLAAAINAPRFDEDAVTRVRAQLLASLRADATDPRAIMGRAFREAMYPGHPYERNSEGTEETVAALTADELRAAHTRALTRDRLTVGVVGDITAEELGPILDRLFGDLPESGPPLPAFAAVPEAPATLVIDYPAPQSRAQFGHVGLKRDDPDFLAAYVLNQIVGGGGYRSRLNAEVREKRGLTYGISTFLASGSYGAVYAGGVSSSNDTVAQALDLVRAEWDRVATEGVTAAELEAAKRYLTGSYPLRFTGSGRIAGTLVGLQIAGEPITYIAERNDRVEALTLEEINRVAARLFQPDQLKVIVVGQPEGIQATQ